MSDYIESLFQGIDILIDKKLEGLAFDTTIICTVTDNTNSKNGEYRVSDGNTIYIVYSEDSSYKVGEQVRVEIPNNDYTRKKFIIGKYGEDESNTPITYVSSTDSVVNISGNLFNKNGPFGLLMNGPHEKRIIWNCEFKDDNVTWLQKAGIYDSLIIKADFQTDTRVYKPVSGVYGIIVDLLIEPAEIEGSYLRKTIEFTSDDVFGDPYNFLIPSTQGKAFSLANANGYIRGIEVSIFQNNLFKNTKGELITYDDAYPSQDNIIIDNIEVALGTNVSNMEDNKLQIYSLNSQEYNYHFPTEQTNTKKIGLAWYNKNEFNKYLGFSDGIYDPNYDEKTYLTEAAINNRMVAQKDKENIPQDKYGLTLAADLEELSIYIPQIVTTITQDLYGVLRELSKDIDPLNSYVILKDKTGNETIKLKKDCSEDEEKDSITISTGLNEYLNTVSNSATEFRDDFIEDFYPYYMDRLKDVSLQETNTEDLEYNLQDDILNKLQKLYNYDLYNNNSQGIIDNILNRVKKHFPSYVSIVENNIVRIDRVRNRMNLIFNALPPFDLSKEFDKDETKITNTEYFTQEFLEGKKNIPNYEPMDLSKYDNKYCVYWYKFVKGASGDDFSGQDWQVLDVKDTYIYKPEDRKEEYDNVGIPKDFSTSGPFNPILSFVNNANQDYIPVNNGLVIQQLEPNTPEQRYMAILFYNHELFKSNELIFENRDTVPNSDILDKADGLYLEHLTNSFNDYPMYNEINYLQDGANGNKSRQVRCHFRGLKARDKDVLPGAHVYWYIPDSSMITFNTDDLISKGFFTDAEIQTDLEMPFYSLEGYTCFYKKIEYNKDKDSYIKSLDETTEYDTRDFWYKIKDYYDPGYSQNYILCKIILEGTTETYEMKEYFTFGMMGNSGTKYTVTVNNVNGNAVQNNKQLYLEVVVRDSDNKKINTMNLTSEENYKDNIKWLFQSDNILAYDIETGTDRIVCNANSNDIKPTSGILKFSLPTDMKIEEVYKEYDAGKIANEQSQITKTTTITLSQLHPIPWRHQDYNCYFSGITKIVYNNFGTLSKGSAFNIPYKLFNTADDTPITDLTWRLRYFKFNSQSRVFDAINIIDSLFPKLVTVGNEYFLEAPSLYDQRLTNEYFIVVEALKANDTAAPAEPTETELSDTENQNGDDIIIWQQPLIIIQNRYESSFLNEWSGDFAIDEYNKYIMSAMVGAGLKDSSNQFSGVLMGDLTIADINSTKDTKQAKTMGLYGFHQGVQSFGFKADGTAFIGKAGAGRIEFNGAEGWIQSGNYSKDTDGMRINLSNGHIDAYNFKLTSKNVLISSNPDDDKLPYFQIQVPKNKEKTEYGNLMFVSDDEWYLQSYKYVEDAFSVGIEWPTLFGYYDANGNFKNDGYYDENGNFVELTEEDKEKQTKHLSPGLKLDLATGALQSVPNLFNEELEGVNLGRLIINQFAFGDTIALAAGENFLVSGNGDCRLKGDWEFWAENQDGTYDGSVGISSRGIFRNRTLVEEEPGKYIWKKLTGQGERWTSWELVADVAKKFERYAAFQVVEGQVEQVAEWAKFGLWIAGMLGPEVVEAMTALVNSGAVENIIEFLIELTKMGLDGIITVLSKWMSDDSEEQ